MAVLPHHRAPVLTLRLVPLVLAWLLAGGDAAAGTLVDVLLAEVETQTVTASDVAVARAMGAFDLAPSTAPITDSDVERLISARLVTAEARRLDLGPTDAEVQAAWRARGADVDAWLAATGVGQAWARRVVEDDLRWRRFVDLRFRAFAFVAPGDVTTALGPGEHPPEAREQVRTRLAEIETRQRLQRWVAEAAARAGVRRLGRLPVPCPLPMPGA